MKRFVTLVILFVFMLAAFVMPASADKPPTQAVQWNVQWGVKDQAGQWTTSWFLSANPTTQLISYTYFPWSVGGGVPFTITPSGMKSTFSAEPSFLYSPRGFQLMKPGATHSLAGMNWFSGTCLPGPKIEFSISPEQKVRITNTTGKSLWLFIDSEPNEGKELKAGMTISRKAPGPQNTMRLQVTPNMMESWNTCATISWWPDR